MSTTTKSYTLSVVGAEPSENYFSNAVDNSRPEDPLLFESSEALSENVELWTGYATFPLNWMIHMGGHASNITHAKNVEPKDAQLAIV